MSQPLRHDPCRRSRQLPLLLRSLMLVPHVEICHLLHLPGPSEVVRQQTLQHSQGLLQSGVNILMQIQYNLFIYQCHVKIFPRASNSSSTPTVT